jgi:hypothetical protein
MALLDGEGMGEEMGEEIRVLVQARSMDLKDLFDLALLGSGR